MEAEGGVYCSACRSSIHLSMEQSRSSSSRQLPWTSRIGSQQRYRGYVGAQVNTFMKKRSFFRPWVYARMRISKITRIGLRLRRKAYAAVRLQRRGIRGLSTRLKSAASQMRLRATEESKKFGGRNADLAGGGERAYGCGDRGGAAR